MKIRLLLCALLSAAILPLRADLPDLSEPILRRSVVAVDQTGRLAAVLRKAEKGEPITLAAIGGSITAGGDKTKDATNRYIAQVTEWFKKTFPNTQVKFVNAGIGGTNSVFGAMRVERDILEAKPDLVIVEWAVNNKDGVWFRESYEGVLRKILNQPQHPAVIQLFFMHKDGESDQPWQEMLGRHYGLPMVSFRDAMFPEISTGRITWESLYADEVHPKDEGHLAASKLLIHLLEAANAQKSSTAASVADVPTPMLSNLYEYCRYTDREELVPASNTGWTRSADGRKWEAPAAASTIEFDVEGKVIFLGIDMKGKAADRVKLSIDGGPLQPLKMNGDRPPIATGLGEGKHRVRIEVAAKGSQPDTDTISIWGIGGAIGR